MSIVKRIALSTAGVLLALSVQAHEATEGAKQAMKAQGFGKLAVAETDDAQVVFGRKGAMFGFVALDPETGEVVGQGKWQAGKMVGTEIVPARHHKDDGTKYGDRAQTRNAGKGDGADHSPDAGETGGKAEHTRGDGAGGGVNSGTGKN